jgi:hypothetical protein
MSTICLIMIWLKQKMSTICAAPINCLLETEDSHMPHVPAPYGNCQSRSTSTQLCCTLVRVSQIQGIKNIYNAYIHYHLLLKPHNFVHRTYHLGLFLHSLFLTLFLYADSEVRDIFCFTAQPWLYKVPRYTCQNPVRVLCARPFNSQKGR